jgi:Spy/CpxP family protein refolding chaperone
MKVSKSKLRKTLIALATAGGLAAWAVPGLTQNAPSAPPGPGMMGGRAGQATEAPGPQGGYGPGCGYGYGRGAGMMYGYGPGYGMDPGMMYGYGHGYGMGLGMMSGYGMGPGMMYGYGPGYGMGPGMMYGYGHGYGMSPGMMYGYGPAYQLLDLSEEQAAKVEKIVADARQMQWSLANESIAASAKLNELLGTEKPDQKAVASAYRALSDLRLKRLELGLDTRAKVDAVLTKEQREQLQSWRGGWMGPWQ